METETDSTIDISSLSDYFEQSTSLISELVEHAVILEEILTYSFILNLILFGVVLFRITSLGKNQRNFW